MNKQIVSGIVCKTKKEWLDERRKSIGASEVATLCGINPYQSALELYLQKKELAPAITETPAMKMGHILEPVIDKLYQEETGRETFDPGEYTIRRNTDYPFIHATFDRNISPCVDHETIGDLQIKTVGRHMVKHWFDEEVFMVPKYVQVQVQVEMAVGGMSWGSVAVLMAGQEFYFADIERDDSFIDRMLVKVEEFQERLDSDDPPEPTGSDSDALKILFPEHTPKKIITLDEPANQIDKDIATMEDEIGWRKKALDEYKNRAKFMIGDAEKAILPNGRAWTYKSSKRAGFATEPTTIRTLRRAKS